MTTTSIKRRCIQKAVLCNRRDTGEQSVAYACELRSRVNFVCAKPGELKVQPDGKLTCLPTALNEKRDFQRSKRSHKFHQWLTQTPVSKARPYISRMKYENVRSSSSPLFIRQLVLFLKQKSHYHLHWGYHSISYTPKSSPTTIRKWGRCCKKRHQSSYLQSFFIQRWHFSSPEW